MMHYLSCGNGYNFAFVKSAHYRLCTSGGRVMPRKATGGEGKRHPLALRTTKELREALEKSAARSGRSLAQEVEYRLEDSLKREQRDYLYAAFKNWHGPLMIHKGSLLMFVGPTKAISLEISPEDLKD